MQIPKGLAWRTPVGPHFGGDGGGVGLGGKLLPAMLRAERGVALAAQQAAAAAIGGKVAAAVVGL